MRSRIIPRYQAPSREALRAFTSGARSRAWKARTAALVAGRRGRTRAKRILRSLAFLDRHDLAVLGRAWFFYINGAAVFLVTAGVLGLAWRILAAAAG